MHLTLSQDSAGDFSLVAAEIIATRSLVTHSQGQTIRDVNALLTRLSKKYGDKKYRRTHKEVVFRILLIAVNALPMADGIL